jgi:GDSL-like Lipase/Acylhydrolase family
LRKLIAITLPAALLATLVLAAAVEVWVRATWEPRKGTPGFFLSDPVRSQRLAPDYTGWFAGVPVRINALGLRDDREYDLAKRPNTFRILVLGDSVTFGHGSVWQHTYPYLLEQQLKAWRPEIDWQVWNAAVPGYNTGQELAHLLEVGPLFHPDLVVVGFFENDLIDNRAPSSPGALTRAFYQGLSFARRHVYSLELYKKVYLQLAWRLAATPEYRRRLEHLDTEEALIANVQTASDLKEQALTPFDRLTDAQVDAVTCYYGQRTNPAVAEEIQRDSGYGAWLNAVRGFQRLNLERQYRIVFFLNVLPLICPDGDAFYDGGTSLINGFFTRVLSEGTPAVSCWDAFRHTRPSQMPNARAHAIGNSNAVKAGVLFSFLRDRWPPDLVHRK